MQLAAAGLIREAATSGVINYTQHFLIVLGALTAMFGNDPFLAVGSQANVGGAASARASSIEAKRASRSRLRRVGKMAWARLASSSARISAALAQNTRSASCSAALGSGAPAGAGVSRQVC